MAKYIDADRLRAEIERRLDELNPKTGMFGDRPLRAVNPRTFPRESELEKVLYLIDSLQQEQPEVDLEKEIANMEFMGVNDARDIGMVARHFFELGQRRAAEMYDEVEYNRQRATGVISFEYRIIGRNTIENLDMNELENAGIGWGDEVIVQIRKKEESK